MRDGRVLVVIPVQGGQELTHALLEDVRREEGFLDVTVVDNRGDYPRAGTETVLSPGENLGWAGATNFGTSECLTGEHDAVVWLNNDTRLSTGFFAGLVRAWRESGAGLIGPLYDCYWNHQRPARTVSVGDYRPRARQTAVPFVDGTCMFVPTPTLDAVGMLDADAFAPVGWGADLDYGLAVRRAGLSVVATGLAYLHHEKAVTAKAFWAGGMEEYGSRGDAVMEAGMTKKWGAGWRDRVGIDPETKQTRPVSGFSRLFARTPRWHRSG